MALEKVENAATTQQDGERPLVQQAATRLLETLPRVFKQMMNECKDRMPDVLADFGETQIRTVHMLAHGDCTIGEIARRMHVTAPTVSRMVDSLVSKGLVERRPDAGDRRIIWLTLSSSGREFAEQMQQVLREAATKILGSLSDEQLQTVLAAANILQSLVPTETQPTNQ